MELINAPVANNRQDPEGYNTEKNYLISEMLESSLCGLAIVKSNYDAYGNISDFSIKAMNYICRQITGVAYEDVMHKTLLSLYPGPDGYHFLQKFIALVGSQSSAHLGTTTGKTDGNIWSIAGVAHGDEVIVTFTNLSDSDLIREMINQTSITIEVQNAIRDNDNNIVDFETMYVRDGSSQRHAASKFAIGKKLMQMMPPDVVRNCFQDFVDVLEHDSCIQLKQYCGTHGLKKCIRNSVVKFNDSVIITFLDITGKVANDLSNDTSQLLVRAYKELDELTKIIAHDLSEPLRKITMFYSLLERSLDDPGKRKKFSRVIHRSIHMMHIKLEDLLLYLHIQHNLKLITVNMNMTLRSVLFSLNDNIHNPATSITVDALPEIMADASMMFMLFQRLLVNAIGFNKSSQRTVHVRCDTKVDEYIFSVEDNGIGIDKKYQYKIFNIFQKLHSGTDNTGIGLPICKKIVELHGGMIWFESVPGQGSTFYISIPKLECTNVR
ncbi:MAG: hypothetical protein EOP56_04800 [Sphingobacteriales bacterium]|nr:MAG: hypothetical protein EOP56_04800 [Sphingobacteriales bacterium]